MRHDDGIAALLQAGLHGGLILKDIQAAPGGGKEAGGVHQGGGTKGGRHSPAGWGRASGGAEGEEIRHSCSPAFMGGSSSNTSRPHLEGERGEGGEGHACIRGG